MDSGRLLRDQPALAGQGTGLQGRGVHDDAAIAQIGQGILGVGADGLVRELAEAVVGGAEASQDPPTQARCLRVAARS